MDHLIHLLVKKYLPEIEHCHKWQTLGMEGLNLAEKCCQQILTCAPKTLLAKIKKIDDLHFEVQSSSSLKCYQIDLSTKTCNCSDFQNISLCKHIAAIVHFFGGQISDPDHLAMEVEVTEMQWLKTSRRARQSVTAQWMKKKPPPLLSFCGQVILSVYHIGSILKRQGIQELQNLSQ